WHERARELLLRLAGRDGRVGILGQSIQRERAFGWIDDPELVDSGSRVHRPLWSQVILRARFRKNLHGEIRRTFDAVLFDNRQVFLPYEEQVRLVDVYVGEIRVERSDVDFANRMFAEIGTENHREIE